MDRSEDILSNARQMLQEEINILQQNLHVLKKRLAQLDKILGSSATNAPTRTISDALIDILQSSPEPLATADIVQRFRALGISQRAKNPHNSIQALLHHLKKATPPKVFQDLATGKWYAPGR